MALKAMNIKLEEAEIMEIKNLAKTYHMSITDTVRAAIKEYSEKLKQDPYYRLTNNVALADEAESREILDSLNDMTDDDLSIAATETVYID